MAHFFVVEFLRCAAVQRQLGVQLSEEVGMSGPKTTKLLTAKRLIDGTGTAVRLKPAILIEGDTIREISDQDKIVAPSGCQLLDLSEWTVMPGIVDAHMHFIGLPTDKWQIQAAESDAYRALRAAGEARKMLQSGVTSARCLGSSIGPDLRRAIREGHVPGPRIVAAGEFISATGGTWDHITYPVEWIRLQGLIADGVDGVREMVRRRIRQGANVIKVGLSKGLVDDEYAGWGDDPRTNVASYSPEEVRALTDEAHRNKLKVSAHCIGDESVRLALETGVDVIEHGYGISQDTRKMLVDRNILVVTTICQLFFHLQAIDSYHYPAGLRKIFQRHIDTMRADFESGLEAGVRFALGTDLTGEPTHPQHMAAKEFELATSWGMQPMDALSAGTRISAEALGMDHRIGSLEVGKLADIIGFKGDPLRDITALQQIQFVMLGGDVVVNKVNSKTPPRESTEL